MRCRFATGCMVVEGLVCASCTAAGQSLYMPRRPHQQSQMQTLDAAATAALEAGETIRVCYDTGYTHRLCLRPPLPPPTGNTLKHLLSELVLLPVDVFAEPSLQAAESVVQGIARRHGTWRAWSDEEAYIKWLLRSSKGCTSG